jgi:hypothetical protein
MEPQLIINMVLGAAIWAEVIGVPVAWLKLRRSDVWQDRPSGVRRIDLLATFVAKITALAAMLGAVAAASALAASGM